MLHLPFCHHLCYSNRCSSEVRLPPDPFIAPDSGSHGSSMGEAPAAPKLLPFCMVCSGVTRHSVGQGDVGIMLN